MRDPVEKGKVNKVKGEYPRVAKELAVTERILIRRKQLVIPKGEDGVLTKDILTAAHQGHQGISQLKNKLRSAVYWPNITKDAEEEVKEYLACQATSSRRHHADMLTPSEPPRKIWEKVGTDHWGLLLDGSKRCILVVQDYKSKYLEVIIVDSTGAADNIKALEGYSHAMVIPLKW